MSMEGDLLPLPEPVSTEDEEKIDFYRIRQDQMPFAKLLFNLTSNGPIKTIEEALK